MKFSTSIETHPPSRHPWCMRKLDTNFSPLHACAPVGSSPPRAPFFARCVCLSCVFARGPGMRSAHTHTHISHHTTRTRSVFNYTAAEQHKKYRKKAKTKTKTTTRWGSSIALTISQSKSTPNPFCYAQMRPADLSLTLTLSPILQHGHVQLKKCSHTREENVTTCRWAHSQHASTACPSSSPVPLLSLSLPCSNPARTSCPWPNWPRILFI